MDSFEQEAAENDAHRKLLWLSQQVSHIPTCNTISELFHFVLMLSICCVDCTHLHHFLSSQPHQFAESCKFCLFYPPGKAEVHLQMIWKRVLLNFFNLYLWNSSLRSLGMFCFRVMDKTLGSSCLFMAGGALHGLKANTTWNNESTMMIIIMVIAWWWRWSLLQTQGLSIREKMPFC